MWCGLGKVGEREEDGNDEVKLVLGSVVGDISTVSVSLVDTVFVFNCDTLGIHARARSSRSYLKECRCCETTKTQTTPTKANRCSIVQHLAILRQG